MRAGQIVYNALSFEDSGADPLPPGLTRTRITMGIGREKHD